MRAKSVLLLLLALSCGLVAAVGVTQVMGKRGEAEAAPEMVPVFVAVKDIPQSEPIVAQMVKQEDWPRDRVPALAVVKWDDLHNRRPKATIFAGSPILDNQLLGKGQSDLGPRVLIPAGYRVIGVKVDSEAAIGSIVRPGDRVDVLVHVRADPNRGMLETVTLGVLQNVKVFAVNDTWEAQGSDKAVAAKTVSLQVTPHEAQLVTLAAETGQIRLLMRGPDDDKRVEYPKKYFGDIVGAEAQAGKPTTKSVAEEAIWKAIKALQTKPEAKPETKQAKAEAKPEKTPAVTVAIAEAAPKPQQHMMVVMNGDDATAMLLEAPQGQSSEGVWRVRATSRDDAQAAVKPAPVKSPSAQPPATEPAHAEPAAQGDAPARKPKEGGAGPDPVKNLETLEQQIKAAEKGL